MLQIVAFCADPVPQTVEWSNHLMDMFFEDLEEINLHRIKQLMKDGNYCRQCVGVQCEQDAVIRVNYSYVDFRKRNLNLSALPHSTTFISLVSCGQHFEVNTRTLSRNLMVRNMSINRLFGGLDLTNLPLDVRVVRFFDNLIRGPLCLRSLPPSIELIDLSRNKINQHTLWYGDLPKTGDAIRLNQRGRNEITEALALNEDDKSRGEVIFFGVKKIG